MSLTRRSALGHALLGIAVLPLDARSVGAEAPAAPRILTALPAAAALARALLEGTGAEVVPVQPDRLPPSRLPSYLSGRGADALAQVTSQADAVLTLRSLWPGDPLYPHARRSNLRITEIDMATPLDGALPGIARRAPARNDAVYQALDLTPMEALEVEMAPWMSPAALSHMAAITAADLQRLHRGAADRIASNRDSLAAEMRDLRARAEQGLLAAPDLSCLTLTPAASYLAADLGLDLLAEIIAAPREWTPGRATLLTGWLRENAVTAVLTDKPAEGDLRAAIADAGAREIPLLPVGGSDATPLPALKASIDGIIAGFA
ncbi:zinc ABC transporter substrate-binding protein (plasmid) [Cereibacter azotoformans]|uniref:metal ABC transporter solute-binding protein, Zn/Mn family n=1 Tax=Cereibacter azotoformans TaxID=43057 RepID=UPI001EEC3F75|nr:zinc ABC transporter substrate-binding protein [Cereibacter azotoformans]ULB12398.1 zinc ABC transporter substrate-binding protein [Cereibacter azotoformans]